MREAAHEHRDGRGITFERPHKVDLSCACGVACPDMLDGGLRQRPLRGFHSVADDRDVFPRRAANDLAYTTARDTERRSKRSKGRSSIILVPNLDDLLFRQLGKTVAATDVGGAKGRDRTRTRTAGQAPNDPRCRGRVDAVFLRQLGDPDSRVGRVTPPHFAHALLSDRVGLPVACHPISGIVSFGSSPQMVWLHAKPIVAGMQDGQAIRNRPLRQFVGDAMSRFMAMGSPPDRLNANRDDSVADLPDFPLWPRPQPTGIRLLDIRPEQMKVDRPTAEIAHG